MNCEFDNNCKGSLLIKKCEEEVSRVEKRMEDNVDRLDLKHDIVIKKVDAVGAAVNNRMWVMSSGILLILITVIVTAVFK